MIDTYLTPKTQFHVTLAAMVAIMVGVVSSTWFISDKVNTLSNVVVEQNKQNQRLAALEEKIDKINQRGVRVANELGVAP